MLRFLTGQLSKKDYEISKESIGIGCFGEVIKGSYKGNGVAIKVMPYNADTVKICNKEKKILERLTKDNAPNVVKYYGFDYQTDPCRKKTFSVVMEYMSKGDLSNYIETEITPLSWQLRYKIMCQITTALEFIHSKGYVFSDMKGDNVLLDENFNAKLCDFGFTHKRGGTHRSGTIPYAAPEMLIGDSYSDFSTDVFSLAMTLWEIAAWRKPHRGVPVLDVVKKLKEEAPNNRLPIPANCPPNIAKLITWGWSNDPAKRPSAKQMLDELLSERTQTQIPRHPAA